VPVIRTRLSEDCKGFKTENHVCWACILM
jgi:hypothetical protein